MSNTGPNEKNYLQNVFPESAIFTVFFCLNAQKIETSVNINDSCK